MPRILFSDDYSEGAHPAILDAIRDANGGQEEGYGLDSWSRLAAERIVAELGAGADVHLLSGGTQANAVCLASMLRHHEGVVAAATAHIEVHETGAIEATGHKVITVPSPDGRLTPALLDDALMTHEDEHTVLPRVVFVSQATESGSVYSLADLRALAGHAHERGLYAYLDGARLSMALAALGDASLRDIAATGIDIFYVGGTKNGALCGEAVVILNEKLRGHFRYHMKQRGGLLAKGRLLGAQFARFFDEDRLWYHLGHVANSSAARLEEGLRAHGVTFMQEREVNQLFAVLPRDVVTKLRDDFGFHTWRRWDDEHDVVRFVCSWATRDEDVDALVARAGELLRP